MKREVLIKIKGIQRQDGDEDSMELITVGHLFKKQADYFISYIETEASGYAGCRTVVKVENGGRVLMDRYGKNRSQITIEKGVRHQSRYQVEGGALMIGVIGQHIESTIGDDGGELRLGYSLDINAHLAYENEVTITVRSHEPT